MDGTDLQSAAVAAAEPLPEVSSGYPFTDHLLVYKVAGRVFLIVTEDPQERIITVKADPARARALQADIDSAWPGRYLDKRHWLSLGAGTDVTRALVEDLVRHSYDLAFSHLPAGRRNALRRRSPDIDRGGARHD